VQLTPLTRPLGWRDLPAKLLRPVGNTPSPNLHTSPATQRAPRFSGRPHAVCWHLPLPPSSTLQTPASGAADARRSAALNPKSPAGQSEPPDDRFPPVAVALFVVHP